MKISLENLNIGTFETIETSNFFAFTEKRFLFNLRNVELNIRKSKLNINVRGSHRIQMFKISSTSKVSFEDCNINIAFLNNSQTNTTSFFLLSVDKSYIGLSNSSIVLNKAEPQYENKIFEFQGN